MDMNKFLLDAARNGDTDTVKVLVADGADLNAKDEYGETAMMKAALYEHADIVRLSLNALRSDVPPAAQASSARTEDCRAWGANVNAKNEDGETALMRAARCGHTDTVKTLIATGSDVNAQGKNGNTALSLAIDGGHTETANALRAAGAK